jgi:hypothetical protein
VRRGRVGSQHALVRFTSLNNIAGQLVSLRYLADLARGRCGRRRSIRRNRVHSPGLCAGVPELRAAEPAVVKNFGVDEKNRPVPSH